MEASDNDSLSRFSDKYDPISFALSSIPSSFAASTSLKAVDLVIKFEEKTPLKLILAIMPDILVKGGDYKIEDIVGSDEVIKQGGKVISLGFYEGYSSSKYIKRIKKH